MGAFMSSCSQGVKDSVVLSSSLSSASSLSSSQEEKVQITPPATIEYLPKPAYKVQLLQSVCQGQQITLVTKETPEDEKEDSLNWWDDDDSYKDFDDDEKGIDRLIFIRQKDLPVEV